MSNEIKKQESSEIKFDGGNMFSDVHAFAEAWRISSNLSQSDIIPVQYQNKPANVLIALEMAIRMRTSPMQVMQNLYIVNGKPAWSSQYIIAVINSSGKYKQELQFELSGEGEKLSCYAWVIDKNDNKLVGPTITMQMAKTEKWIDKSGSKWKTMPDVMIRYRAASFFGRIYCPDLIMGIYAVEEAESFDSPVIIAEAEIEREAEQNANSVPIEPTEPFAAPQSQITTEPTPEPPAAGTINTTETPDF